MTEQKPLKILPVGLEAGISLMYQSRTVHAAGPVALVSLPDQNLLYCFLTLP
jgi:hypothetical protein